MAEKLGENVLYKILDDNVSTALDESRHSTTQYTCNTDQVSKDHLSTCSCTTPVVHTQRSVKIFSSTLKKFGERRPGDILARTEKVRIITTVRGCASAKAALTTDDSDPRALGSNSVGQETADGDGIVTSTCPESKGSIGKTTLTVDVLLVLF